MSKPQFGDDYNTVQGAWGKVMIRLVLCVPLGVLGIACCITVVGIPIGLPLLMACGAFISKPLRAHPNYKVPSRQRIEPTIDYDREDLWD